MSTYAIGDLHGRADLLSELLTSFEPEPTDHVVFLGDYIDRGPDSRGVIDILLSYRNSHEAKVIFLKGNHESRMLQTMSDYSSHSWILGMQGLSTVRSYSPPAAEKIEAAMSDLGPTLITEKPELPYDDFFSEMPSEHIEFFKSLELHEEIEGVVCVHAGVSADCQDVGWEDSQTLLWGQQNWWQEYRGTKTVVYGHWGNAARHNKLARPFICGNTIGIDCVDSGSLLAIRFPDLTTWNASIFQDSPMSQE